MPTDIAALARESYEELWNKGRLDYVDQAFAPDFVGHDVFPGEFGREEQKERVRQFREAFPDAHFWVEDVIVAGDKAVVRFTASGTHLGGAFHGIAPTRRNFSLQGIRISRYEGGKMKESWTEWDVLRLFQCLGVTPHLAAGQGLGAPTLEMPRSELRQ